MNATAAIVAQALKDANVHLDAPDAIARQVIDALEAGGYTLRKKSAPRKAAAPTRIFAPSTGDASLDEFMRAHHDPKYKPAPLPKAPGMPSAGKLSDSNRMSMESEWNRAVAARMSSAEHSDKALSADQATLREVVAIHRSPWRREHTGDARRTWYSQQHPGIIIAEAPGKRYEIRVDGKRFEAEGHSGDYYRSDDAERAADKLAAERAA